jgi:hypothetical protein
MQAAQKDCLDHPPNPGVKHTFSRARPQRARKRGGTYQASLEPLASINCERIGILPPVNRLVERFERRENKAGEPFSVAYLGGAGVLRQQLVNHLLELPASA